MLAAMARQRGQLQLEQSDMCLALNMAKMVKESFLPATIQQTQQLIKKPRAEVREEKMRVVVFPGHEMVKAAMARQPAMVRENQRDGCLPCHNSTVKNPQTCSRHKGTGAPPPELVPPPPRTPPAPPGGSVGSRSSKIDAVPPGYVYIHTPLPSAELFNLNQYAKDRKCDKDFNSDLLTDNGPSTA